MRHHQEEELKPDDMTEVIVSLRGWHVPLAHAELCALLPNMTIQATSSKRWYSVSGDMTLNDVVKALSIAANVEAIFDAGVVIQWDGSYENVKSLLKTSISKYSDTTVSTRSWKHGPKIDNFSLSEMARHVGGVLTSQHCTINFQAPEQTYGLCSDAQSQSILCGWLVGHALESFGAERRQATERPFFKPVSLDPKLARTAVNLACGPISDAFVLDPMTGTGGFMIEASLSGRNGIAVDQNSAMVEGAKANLRWAHGDEQSPSCIILRGDATYLEHTIPDEIKGNIGGVVLDPPYGRNSQGTLGHVDLLQKTLFSVNSVIHHNAEMVLILPITPMEIFAHSGFSEEDIVPLHGSFEHMKQMLEHTHWMIRGMFVERVHKSLSRLVLHAKFSPRD